MTKVEKDGQGRFIGDAQQGPPRANKGARGTCVTCGSSEWRRLETAAREQFINIFADGTAVPKTSGDWDDIAEVETGEWACRNGHQLEDAVLIDLFDTAMELGEPIGV